MLAVLALSSCGTVGITKRYHNGGFHIDLGRGGESSDAIVAKREKRKGNPSADKHQPVSTAQSNAGTGADDVLVTNLPEINAPEEAVQNTEEIRNSNNSSPAVLLNKDQLKSPKNGLLNQIRTVSKIKKAAKASSRADVPDDSIMWILYLILCFVLPPLAYYLIRRETDTLFWICLICFLLWGSWFFGFSYGLLGLISVIIALLALLGS